MWCRRINDGHHDTKLSGWRCAAKHTEHMFYIASFIGLPIIRTGVLACQCYYFILMLQPPYSNLIQDKSVLYINWIVPCCIFTAALYLTQWVGTKVLYVLWCKSVAQRRTVRQQSTMINVQQLNGIHMDNKDWMKTVLVRDHSEKPEEDSYDQYQHPVLQHITYDYPTIKW